MLVASGTASWLVGKSQGKHEASTLVGVGFFKLLHAINEAHARAYGQSAKLDIELRIADNRRDDVVSTYKMRDIHIELLKGGKRVRLSYVTSLSSHRAPDAEILLDLRENGPTAQDRDLLTGFLTRVRGIKNSVPRPE